MNQCSNKENIKIINSLQSLRFIAILMIFYTHIISDNIIYATCGISFFVILSGFVYGYKDNEKDIKVIPETKKLLKKRVLQFYPLHIITLIMSISLESQIPPLSVVMQNLLLLQCYFTTNYFCFNGTSWFLSLCMTLTIFTYPFKKAIRKIKENSNLILLFLVFVIVNLIYCYQIYKMNVDLQYWLYICPIVGILEYVCGMIVGNLMYRNNFKISKIMATILEIISIWIIIIILLIQDIPEYIYRNFIWVIPMSLTIAIFSMEKGYISKIFNIKWLVNLGNLSFAIFMTHQIILRYIDKYSLMENIALPEKFLIELIICIIVAKIVSNILNCIKIDFRCSKK